MSQPSRPQARGPAQRRRREVQLEQPIPLEDRRLPAPVVTLYPLTATFTATTPTPTNSDLGTVTVTASSTAAPLTAAPITSVAELTSNQSFGGDIVNITPGPGGVFGSDVYAISRGAGGNTSAINRPGVIYRVDPATGKASVFFDLNTVLSQTDPASTTPTPAGNSMGAGTGLVNWYSMAFDPNGKFDGTPSLFVASVDRSDPNKNIIFQISPSGTLIGVFAQFTDGLASLKFNINPTAILIPPQQDQSFLNGMLAGNGESSTTGTFAALYFDASVYSPGQVLSNSNLPNGVAQEPYLGLPTTSNVLNVNNTVVAGATVNTGPIVGMTSSNASYGNQVFSVFTDFGTPAGGGIPARPGYSGVQGSATGNLFIGEGANATTTLAAGAATDLQPAAETPFRRFYGIAFDQYGYFSQGFTVSSSSSSTTSGTTISLGSNGAAYAGSLFVSDLASGLYVTVTPIAPLPTTPILVPIQSTGGTVSVTTDSSGTVIPVISGGTTLGGRIIRISPTGTVYQFAQGFDTSGSQTYTSFENSTLSIGFSSDGTILYAADNQGIWQFKTTADLADSTSGSLIGLSDLRALGVPYDGQNQAIAVVDTGVAGTATSFRGRVAPGYNVTTGSLGNQDLASPTGSVSTTGTGGTGGGGGAGGGAGGTGSTTNQVLSIGLAGHGTPVAGVVAQLVPQATIDPIDIFNPFAGAGSVSLTGSASTGTGGTGGTGGAGGGAGGAGGTSTIVSNDNGADATTLYDGLQYLVQHPFVNDPIRPGQVDRVIAAVYAFGTPFTFQSEAQAYKQFPQVVIALKNQYHKLRKEGIANIAATGEFGAPLGAGASTSSGATGGVGGTTGATTTNTLAANNAQNSRVGDVQGISLPAVINEVISVTGVYSFPFINTPSTSPIDTPSGVIPQPAGPILLFGNNLTITSGSGSSGGTGGTGNTGTNATSNVQLLASGDINIWADRIPGAVNRSVGTDFAAPAFNVPTFARPFAPTLTNSATTGGTGGTGGGAGGTGGTGGTGTGTTTGVISNPLTFNQVGTSMSAAITTGAYALVSSALNYWTGLAHSPNGYTADAYLNTPVGTNSLTFGRHAFKNLSAWNTPDGINGILAWTAVPATDVNDQNTISTPFQLPGSTAYPSYARISVSNAIAAVEGTQAINYLTRHHDWGYIDTSHTGFITAQELTTFVDNAASMGLPEAGAMAALLGGTATYGPVEAGVNNTVYNENPDQPAAEQRRFNFFNYAAYGQLTGAISINAYKMLGRTLLPSPDAYTIIDRQRASANGFLLAPTTPRNFTGLARLSPSFMWVPRTAIARYRNITPAQFTVGQNQKTGTYLPIFTLFDPTITSSANTTNNSVIGMTRSGVVQGRNLTVNYTIRTPSPTPSPTSSSPGSTTAGTGSTSTGTGTGSGNSGSSNTSTGASSTASAGTGSTSTGASSTGSGTASGTTGGSGNTSPTSTGLTSSTTASTEKALINALLALAGQGGSSTGSPTTTPTSSPTSSPSPTSTGSTSPSTPTTVSVAGTMIPVSSSTTTGVSGTTTGLGTTSPPTPNTPTPTSAGTPTSTPTPTSTGTPTSTATPSSATPPAPAPLAYAVTIDPTASASPSAQAQVPSLAERRAMNRMQTRRAHPKKKESSLAHNFDKFWSRIKKPFV